MLNSKEAIRFSVSKPISHFSLTFFADDSMAWTLWGVPGGLHGRCFWCTRRSTEPFNNIGSSRRGRRVYHYGLLQHKKKSRQDYTPKHSTLSTLPERTLEKRRVYGRKSLFMLSDSFAGAPCPAFLNLQQIRASAFKSAALRCPFCGFHGVGVGVGLIALNLTGKLSSPDLNTNSSFWLNLAGKFSFFTRFRGKIDVTWP